MDGEVEEAVLQRRVLARLQASPCTAQELICTLDVSERAVGAQLGSLVAAGLVEETPSGGEGGAPVYRLVQQRRRRSAAGRSRQGSNGSMHSPTGHPQGALQHGFVPGMLPYHPAPQGFYSPQVLYYPAGMAPYQQAPMGTGAGAQQWAAVRGPGMPGMPPRQQNGGGYPHPMQGPYFYAAGPGAMPVGPPTPSSGSQQRQMPMTRTGSSASASSTGWGGVPLSQSAAEMVASGLVPSPRSSPRKHVADSREVGNAAGEAAGVAASSGASSSAVPTVPRQQGDPALTQAGAAGPAEPEGAASKLESASQADPSSSGSDDMGEERQQGAGRRSSGEGSGSGGARSSPGGSSGSRRSRGNRERQECSFYLKTGTCAYGDSCKFAHPFDKAPRVEFNSLGLPLRPGEPECSFYLKHYRCAFGHTCKFHHPEMPSPPPTAVPVFPVHQYAVHQYPQASNTPMLSSVLGLHHKGPGGGGAAPGAHMQAPGMAGNQHGTAAFFMAPHFPGGPHPGFASLPPALHAMMGNPPARSSQQRGTSAGGSSSSRAAGSAAAAAAAVAGALPLPLPVALPGTSPGSTSGDAAMHAALPEQQQQQQIVAAGLASSPPTAAGVEEVGAAAGTSMEQVGGIACSPTLPPPIMVFHSPRQAAGLAASLQRLQLSGGARDEVPEAPGQDDPAEPAGSAAAEGSSAGRSGSGSLGGLAHQQPRAELAIA
ncbi:hypothetical protein ABPG77_004617 [Micractinium sp. CCAP 211/92]